jgi:hypothetical protein
LSFCLLHPPLHPATWKVDLVAVILDHEDSATARADQMMEWKEYIALSIIELLPSTTYIYLFRETKSCLKQAMLSGSLWLRNEPSSTHCYGI